MGFIHQKKGSSPELHGCKTPIPSLLQDPAQRSRKKEAFKSPALWPFPWPAAASGLHHLLPLSPPLSPGTEKHWGECEAAGGA